MTISLGNDHAGFRLRASVLGLLRDMNLPVIDNGTRSEDPVDFPDIVALVCKDVLSGRADRGLLLCGTGVGASMAANKYPGIRASVIHDCHSAHQGVEHDDMNVIAIGAQIVGPWLAKDIITTYLNARFADTEELRRRLDKIAKLEAEVQKGAFGGPARSS